MAVGPEAWSPTPPGPRAWLRGFAGALRLGVSLVSAYRAALALELVSLGFYVGVPLSLWLALYRGHPGLQVAGMSLRSLFTYTFLSVVIQVLTNSNLMWNLRQQIRDGTVAMLFLRPLPVPISLLATDLGNLPVLLPMMGLVALFGIPLLQPLPPASGSALLLALVALGLALILVKVLYLLLGTFCFWTLEGRGLIGGSTFVMNFLSGQTLPVSFFPGALRAVAAFLPFQGLVNLPVMLYLGNLRGAAAVGALARQAGWTAGLAVVLAWVWARATRRLVVQGG